MDRTDYSNQYPSVLRADEHYLRKFSDPKILLTFSVFHRFTNKNKQLSFSQCYVTYSWKGATQVISVAKVR